MHEDIGSEEGEISFHEKMFKAIRLITNLIGFDDIELLDYYYTDAFELINGEKPTIKVDINLFDRNIQEQGLFPSNDFEEWNELRKLITEKAIQLGDLFLYITRDQDPRLQLVAFHTLGFIEENKGDFLERFDLNNPSYNSILRRWIIDTIEAINLDKLKNYSDMLIDNQRMKIINKKITSLVEKSTAESLIRFEDGNLVDYGGVSYLLGIQFHKNKLNLSNLDKLRNFEQTVFKYFSRSAHSSGKFLSPVEIANELGVV